jgi:hypothetical protein
MIAESDREPSNQPTPRRRGLTFPTPACAAVARYSLPVPDLEYLLDELNAISRRRFDALTTASEETRRHGGADVESAAWQAYDDLVSAEEAAYERLRTVLETRVE